MKKYWSNLEKIADDIYGGAGKKHWNTLLRMSKLHMFDLIDIYYRTYNVNKGNTEHYKQAARKIRRVLQNALTARNFSNKMSSSEF